MAHRPPHKGLDFSAVKTYPHMKCGRAVIQGLGTHPQGKTSSADLRIREESVMKLRAIMKYCSRFFVRWFGTGWDEDEASETLAMRRA